MPAAKEGGKARVKVARTRGERAPLVAAAKAVGAAVVAVVAAAVAVVAVVVAKEGERAVARAVN